MRKLSYFAALVVAMVAVSCAKEIDAPVADSTVKFTASFDAAASKAVLKPGADQSKVEWEAGDQVSVLAADANYLYVAQTPGVSTTLVTEATDVPADGQFFAVYPYDADAAVADGVITTELPAEQTAVLGSFSTHLAVAQAAGTKLAFKNVCGLVKVNVSAENVTKVVFEGNSGEIVAGAVNVTVADAPTWAAVAEQGAASVTLAAASGTLAKGDYYFAVLPQTFAAGFKVTAYKGESASVIRNVATEVTIARADIVAGKSFGIEGQGTEAAPYIIMTAQDMVDMRSLAKLGGETWFKLGADIDMKGVTGWIPVNYDQNFERKIHFDGDNHTISNFTCDKSVTGANYPSLFGVLYGSCKNLKVDNASIKSSSGCGVIGGYVGTSGKPGLVENVTITNSTVYNIGDAAGGVCGNAREATFKNVSFQGTVTSTITSKASKSGGFVGIANSSASFEKCSVDAVVNGANTDLGGFVGYVTGSTFKFTDCDAKVNVTTTAPEKNRCGGLIGWNQAANATITNCHVLEGSVVTDAAERTEAKNSNTGGFIGYGDNTGTVLTIKNCSSKATVNAGSYGAQASGFIASLGYESVTTIENCSVKCDVTGHNYTAGFVSYLGEKSKLTITKCHFEGTVAGNSSVAGLVAAAVTKDGSYPELAISKSYVKGTINPKGTNNGGLVGQSQGTLKLENSYADVTVTMQTQQYGAGIVGLVKYNSSIKNCFAKGQLNIGRGCAFIVGRVEGTSTIEGCVAWGNIKTSRSATQYSPGAIVGTIQTDAGTYKSCFRNADMVLDDPWMKLVDHDDVVNGRPALPVYEGATADKNQYAYHGKAAAADATISSVAKSLGWDETIWDLSGAVPVLK